MDENFWRGVDLYFKSQGIKDERQKEAMRQKIQESRSQMEQQRFGMEQQKFQAQMQAQQEEKIRKEKIKSIMTSAFTPERGDFETGESGIQMTKEWMQQRFLPKLGEVAKETGEYGGFVSMAEKLYPKEEEYTLSPGEVRYRGGKQIGVGPAKTEITTPTWVTQAEAIKAGKQFEPKGKTTVPKPTKGGYTYDYETPSLGEETQERQNKVLGANLRKEFNALQPIKDYRDIETRFNVMEQAIKESKTTNNLVAVDQALITIFNKMTDPQSVVRESEYIRTPQDLSLWNRLKGKVTKYAAGGAGLTQDDRNALYSMAKKFQGAYKSKFDQLRNEYRGYAVDYGINPETVIKGNIETGSSVKFMDAGKSYNIPSNMVNEFQKDHPQAQRVR